jgi:hypothetical protein
MATTRLISSLALAGVLAASVSTAAVADDHRGHRGSSGNSDAIALGILGVVVLGSLIANSQQSAPPPQPVYVAPQPQPQPYYAPQPVQQVYYGAPQPQVVYVDQYGRPYHRRHDHRYYDRY